MIVLVYTRSFSLANCLYVLIIGRVAGEGHRGEQSPLLEGSYGQENSRKKLFMNSQEKSGNLIETCRKSGKSREFLSSMQINSLIPNRQLYTWHSL